MYVYNALLSTAIYCSPLHYTALNSTVCKHCLHCAALYCTAEYFNELAVPEGMLIAPIKEEGAEVSLQPTCQYMYMSVYGLPDISALSFT